MPIGFKNCCCKACTCEKSWPGDNGSLHAVWNVNEPILGTPTNMQGLVERSSAAHLYRDYAYQVDQSVPYWASLDPLWQPYKIQSGVWVKDLLINRRIRIPHPDLPHFTHNVACAPKYKNYFDEVLPWIGTTRGNLTAWATSHFDYEYFWDVNSVAGQDFVIKDTDLKCHSFVGHPATTGAYWQRTDERYHYYYTYGESNVGIDGGGITPVNRFKKHLDTISGFLFTNEVFPDKHFHKQENPWWPSDQCNTNATPGSDWQNRWPYCGWLLRGDLRYQSSYLTSFMPTALEQIQGMSGQTEGYRPFPFIPPVGVTPVTEIPLQPRTEASRFWSLELGFNYKECRFYYVEGVRFTDGTIQYVVRCQSGNSPDILLGDQVTYNPNASLFLNCFDGLTFPFTLRLQIANPQWLGNPLTTTHNCEIHLSWVAV